MDRKTFEDHFRKSLDENLVKVDRFYKYEVKVFFELRTTIYEISHCLLLDLNKSAITLTNHFLERLLKLALINHEVGLEPVPISQWNAVFEEPNRKYGEKSLGNVIELCKKQGLIKQVEFDFLYNVIREQIRNGFSHADGKKILVDLPEQMEGLHGTFDNSKQLEIVKLNQKQIPSIQSALIDNFAKENAFDYFESIFNLLINIENRLLENKHDNTR